MKLFDRKPEIVIEVRAAPRGRVTGWSVLCPEDSPGCGPMPVLASGQGPATAAAERHAKAAHADRSVRIVIDVRPPRRGKARRRG